MSDSYVRNCVIRQRPGDGDLIVFDADMKPEAVRLDGYVICPIEQIEEVASALRVDANKPTPTV